MSAHDADEAPDVVDGAGRPHDELARRDGLHATAAPDAVQPAVAKICNSSRGTSVTALRSVQTARLR